LKVADLFHIREKGSFTLCPSGAFTICNLAHIFSRLFDTCVTFIFISSKFLKILSYHNKSCKFNFCCVFNLQVGAIDTSFVCFFNASIKNFPSSLFIMFFCTAKLVPSFMTSIQYLLSNATISFTFGCFLTLFISSANFVNCFVLTIFSAVGSFVEPFVGVHTLLFGLTTIFCCFTLFATCLYNKSG